MNYFIIGFYALLVGGSSLAAYYQKRTPFILLFSLTLLAIEFVESRFPWRDFRQDWWTAALALTANIVVAAIFSGADVDLVLLAALGPQVLLSVLAFPIVARMVADLDKLRLLRVREVD